MSHFPLLPKLKEASAIASNDYGVWKDETHDFLNALIKSLAVGGSIKDAGSIDSIPDVWARPLLFQMALFDEQKSDTQQFVKGLHDMVLGEWRAILAMIALKDVKHLALSAQAVHIGEGESGLHGVLKALAPKESISETKANWNDIYVLFYQNIPIAMTSPTTLVAAAADYRSAFGGSLAEPWSRDGKTLADPTDFLTAEDRGALYCWLKKLHEEIRNAIPLAEQEKSPSCMGVLRCLDEYRADVERRGLPAVTDFSRTDAKLGLNIGLFRLLNQTIKPKAATAGDSAVRLVVSPAREQKNILLVSEKMLGDFAEEIGINPTQLIVWSGISANDVREGDLAENRRRIGNVDITGAEWRRPDEFFTERMTLIERPNAIKGSRAIPGAQLLANEGLTPILPIRRELLDFFTPQEIAERINIEMTSEEVFVQFSFPLSGANGAANYRFTKRYYMHDIIFMQTNVPVIEIWPNVRRDGWNKYYLYYENTEAQNQNAEGAGKDFFYVEPWAYGKDMSKLVPNRGMMNRYTARITAFPEALVCTLNESGAGEIESGLLLLEQPPLVTKIGGLSWKMGVDFGTSSTMLYYREGTKNAQPLAFSSRLFQVTDTGAERNNTYLHFIPSTLQSRYDGSFLSIFHLLNTESLSRDIRPLEDGHVFWLTTNNTERFKEEGNKIDSNLKWKNDDTGRRKVAAYVKQICLQSVAEAAIAGVDKIEWNFSFPTAFSKEQQFAFQATCQEAVTDAYTDTCFAADDVSTESWPESKAAAYHFNRLGSSDTNFGDGAICLDIGAGTTDVSVISGQPGRIVYHTSIQFAGRFLFAPIYQNYELFSSRTIDAGNVDEEQRQAIMDADMRENSEEYLKNLKNITGREEIRSVLQQSQLAMGGIFYYLGDVLAALHARGIYAENHVPDIFVGGNGSRVFTWLTGGIKNTNSPFLDTLKHIIVAASGLDENSRFSIHLSANPKIEVANGMIESRPHNDDGFYDERRQTREIFGKGADDYAANAMIAGETFAADGETRNKDEFMSARDVSAGIVVSGIDELKRYVGIFNDEPNIWLDGFAIDEDAEHDIKKRVNSHYASQKGEEIKKIFVEPVFIVALKKFMEKLKNG